MPTFGMIVLALVFFVIFVSHGRILGKVGK